MKILSKALIGATITMVLAAPLHAFDLKDLIPKGGSGQSAADMIGGLLDGVISSDKLSVADIEGTWNYVSPAVSFKSDNLLKKAGGAAAASTIEGQLAPYYKKAGLDKLVITIEPDGKFTLKAGKATLSGTATVADGSSNANFVFNFKAFGKVSAGKINAYVVKGATGSMSLMFDVTKLIEIAKMAGSLTGNSTVKGMASMLESYDGLCAGFKLKK